METIRVDFSKVCGDIRAMHGVNSGPFKTSTGLGDMKEFKEAGFPYVRNHDSSASLFYFGERSNDVPFIFRDMDADENDPANYDFHYTDRFVRDTMEGGASLIYRLGSKIEGGDKKYNVLPPKDYAKYARICEHIIAHYCCGWADGMELPLKYWEIWCEPENPPCWFGAYEDFLPFYEIMAKHLKSRFPELKIGGPGFTKCREDVTRNYVVEFFEYMKAHEVPIDFFSWHCYTDDVSVMTKSVEYARTLLAKYGYENAELILDEWNYVEGWRGESIATSYKKMQTEVGAAFYAEMMLAGQKTGLDQLLYYDVRPDCSFNGLFAPYVFTPFKGYYSFWQFNKLYQLGKEVASESSSEDVCVCAAENNGKCAVQFSFRKDASEEVKINMSNVPAGKSIACYLVDKDHTNDKLWTIEGTASEMSVTVPVIPNSIVLLTIS